MRKFLDNIYLSAAIAAGSSLVIMTLLMLTQIVGRWFDIIVPSTEDFSGFLLAAASFLALPYALRSGSHIRVSLFLSFFPAQLRKAVEFLVLVLVLVLVSYIAWSVSLMVIETWEFEELTQGYVAIPLWIPQVSLPIGLALFVLALFDELVSLILTGETSYLRHEDEQQNEE
ncbi:MAG: TRAP transporter small permease [Gammaproteobacteria bacterium]|jgi:TRAP-type C4-dicarboxylate transport system permease small subunit|nr:TRAP transporter small permease [Gammaproteobacteria bacterium]MBT3723481.1 TRAP transporter small permease [Gammaproteobacteria bacterium]MBT4076605.1 TRAP transporter small permease [Gammaproteobacteria bacterium]MBT4194311.1 TRAP transporter small permease [Gammaproteobacteria bacterium]MBT4450865.1 TRAP transporter small permease [Gammaproteobacteria bacterium]